MKLRNMKSAIVLAALLVVSVIMIGCAGQTVTPAHQDPVTGQIVPAVTNYVPNTVATQIGSTTTVVAPFLPPPWNALLVALGGLVTTGAGAIATYQNSKLRDNRTMLASVIAGVESANNPATKEAIQTVAAASGLGDKLNTLVQKVTAAVPKKS